MINEQRQTADFSVVTAGFQKTKDYKRVYQILSESVGIYNLQMDEVNYYQYKL